MGQFNRLALDENGYSITRKKSFKPYGTMSKNIVESVFEFAYSMTFEQSGEHRANRTGGSHIRKNGEIFSNAFQGKLAEFALYGYLRALGTNLDEPDVTSYRLGKWDDTDLKVQDKQISIKSTKSFGNLLLLEKDDWDENGNYLPNQKPYDFTVLIRMKPFSEEIMKKNRLLYSQEADKKFLKHLILNEKWQYDIPGFITLEDLKNIIQDKLIIEKGSKLNKNTKMDASNYYVQSGDLRNIESLGKMI